MTSRMLKELKSLAPWQWDSQVESHPPGAASLRDFERIDKVFEDPASGKTRQQDINLKIAQGTPITAIKMRRMSSTGSGGRMQEDTPGSAMPGSKKPRDSANRSIGTPGVNQRTTGSGKRRADLTPCSIATGEQVPYEEALRQTRSASGGAEQHSAGRKSMKLFKTPCLKRYDSLTGLPPSPFSNPNLSAGIADAAATVTLKPPLGKQPSSGKGLKGRTSSFPLLTAFHLAKVPSLDAVDIASELAPRGQSNGQVSKTKGQLKPLKAPAVLFPDLQAADLEKIDSMDLACITETKTKIRTETSWLLPSQASTQPRAPDDEVCLNKPGSNESSLRSVSVNSESQPAATQSSAEPGGKTPTQHLLAQPPSRSSAQQIEQPTRQPTCQPSAEQCIYSHQPAAVPLSGAAELSASVTEPATAQPSAHQCAHSHQPVASPLSVAAELCTSVSEPATAQPSAHQCAHSHQPVASPLSVAAELSTSGSDPATAQPIPNTRVAEAVVSTSVSVPASAVAESDHIIPAAVPNKSVSAQALAVSTTTVPVASASSSRSSTLESVTAPVNALEAVCTEARVAAAATNAPGIAPAATQLDKAAAKPESPEKALPAAAAATSSISAATGLDKAAAKPGPPEKALPEAAAATSSISAATGLNRAAAEPESSEKALPVVAAATSISLVTKPSTAHSRQVTCRSTSNPAHAVESISIAAYTVEPISTADEVKEQKAAASSQASKPVAAAGQATNTATVARPPATASVQGTNNSSPSLGLSLVVQPIGTAGGITRSPASGHAQASKPVAMAGQATNTAIATRPHVTMSEQETDPSGPASAPALGVEPTATAGRVVDGLASASTPVQGVVTSRVTDISEPASAIALVIEPIVTASGVTTRLSASAPAQGVQAGRVTNTFKPASAPAQDVQAGKVTNTFKPASAPALVAEPIVMASGVTRLSGSAPAPGVKAGRVIETLGPTSILAATGGAKCAPTSGAKCAATGGAKYAATGGAKCAPTGEAKFSPTASAAPVQGVKRTATSGLEPAGPEGAASTRNKKLTPSSSATCFHAAITNPLHSSVCTADKGGAATAFPSLAAHAISSATFSHAAATNPLHSSISTADKGGAATAFPSLAAHLTTTPSLIQSTPEKVVALLSCAASLSSVDQMTATPVAPFSASAAAQQASAASQTPLPTPTITQPATHGFAPPSALMASSLTPPPTTPLATHTPLATSATTQPAIHGVEPTCALPASTLTPPPNATHTPVTTAVLSPQQPTDSTRGKVPDFTPQLPTFCPAQVLPDFTPQLPTFRPPSVLPDSTPQLPPCHPPPAVPASTPQLPPCYPPPVLPASTPQLPTFHPPPVLPASTPQLPTIRPPPVLPASTPQPPPFHPPPVLPDSTPQLPTFRPQPVLPASTPQLPPCHPPPAEPPSSSPSVPAASTPPAPNYSPLPCMGVDGIDELRTCEFPLVDSQGVDDLERLRQELQSRLLGFHQQQQQYFQPQATRDLYSPSPYPTPALLSIASLDLNSGNVMSTPTASCFGVHPAITAVYDSLVSSHAVLKQASESGIDLQRAIGQYLGVGANPTSTANGGGRRHQPAGGAQPKGCPPVHQRAGRLGSRPVGVSITPASMPTPPGATAALQAPHAPSSPDSSAGLHRQLLERQQKQYNAAVAAIAAAQWEHEVQGGPRSTPQAPPASSGGFPGFGTPVGQQKRKLVSQQSPNTPQLSFRPPAPDASGGGPPSPPNPPLNRHLWSTGDVVPCTANPNQPKDQHPPEAVTGCPLCRAPSLSDSWVGVVQPVVPSIQSTPAGPTTQSTPWHDSRFEAMPLSHVPLQQKASGRHSSGGLGSFSGIAHAKENRPIVDTSVTSLTKSAQGPFATAVVPGTVGTNIQLALPPCLVGTNIQPALPLQKQQRSYNWKKSKLVVG
eukprot:gene18543-25050_t